MQEIIKIVSFFFAAMFYIYVLFSKKSNKYYIGYTSNVFRRLEEHNDPSRFGKYTNKHIPWELKVFFEVTVNRGDALVVERFIKKQKSRSFLEKLIEEKDNKTYFISLINRILERKKLLRAIPRTRD